jgi:hypothetical protein
VFVFKKLKQRKIVSYIYIFILGVFNDAVNSSVYIVLNDRMNNELERIWKEEVVSKFKLLLRQLP